MSLSTADEIEQSCPSSIPSILADFFLKKIEMGSYSSDSDYKHKGKKKKSKHKKGKHKKSKHRHGSKSSSSSRDPGFHRKNEVDDVSSSEEKSIKRLKKIKNMKLNSASIAMLPCIASKPVEDKPKAQSDPCNSSAVENLVFYGPSLELLLSGVESHSPNSKLYSASKVISPEHKYNVDSKDDTSKTKNFVENNQPHEDSKVKKENLSVSNHLNVKSKSRFDVGLNNTPDNVIHGDRTCHKRDSVNDNEIVINKDANKTEKKTTNRQKSNGVTTTFSIKSENIPVLELMNESKSNIGMTLFSNNVETDTLKESVNAKESTASSEEKMKSESNLSEKKEVEKSEQKIEEKKKYHSRSRSTSKSKSAKDNSTKSKHKRKVSRSRSSSRDSHSRKKRKHSLEKSKSHSHKKRSHSRSLSKSRNANSKKLRSKSPKRRYRDRSTTTHRRHSRSKSRRRSHSRSKSRRRSNSRHKDHSLSRSRRGDRSSSRCKDRSSSRSKQKDHSSSKHKDCSSSESRQKECSLSESRQKDCSPSSSRKKDHSPSMSKNKDRSPSRSRKKSRSSSRSRHMERSSSRSRNRHLSSSRSRHKDRSSSRSRHKDRSSSRSRHKDRSSSRSRHKDRSSSRSRYKDRSSSRSRYKDRSSSRSRYKDRSSSRSRHKDRSSSRSRHKDRSSSRSRHKYRSSSRSRHKDRSSSRYKDLSSSKLGKKRKSHSRSRSKSKSRKTTKSNKSSHSRSRSKEKHSNKIDQAKILATARRNVLKMMKNGTLPEGLPVENLKKEQLISIQAGGKSVQELTDFCQRLSQKENDPDDNDDKNDEGADDENGFIHHPFKVKEPAMIKLNIKNAVQLPIKTHAQKIAETARLSSQFPVSSGNQHKQKELEWIPVVPEPPKTESKSAEKKTSANKNSVTTVAVIENTVSPIPPPPQMPVSYPCPPEVPKVTAISVPALVPPPMLPQLLPPPMPPPIPVNLQELPPLIQPEMQSYVMPNNQQMIMPNISIPVSMPAPMPMPSTSVFKPPRKIDISAIVTKRFQALTKLQQNQNDPEALATLQEAQEDIQDWVQSQQVPGLFTGSTDAKVLSVAELCGPKYYKFKKDFFTHAPPVTEGKGMSLLKKMGWNPGEGLGKNKEGSLEPLVLDIKMDKKGLVGEGENSKKSVCSFTKELQGKHPVSALMELCSKRRWKPPLYTCIMDQGPSHKKQFCFKVEVNGVEYQPLNPCSNKKVAKADSAVICLQALNVFPKNPS